jgi:uncharacterized RDD family membrane protein YckC
MSGALPAGDGHHQVDVVPREARPFQGQRAGVVTRTAANVVDFLVIVGVLAGGYGVWCAVRFLLHPARFSLPAPPSAAVLICFAAALFVYLQVSWATTGRSYGDHLLGLRVVNFRGERMRWAGAALRSAFCVAVPIGLYWTVLSPSNRSLQDTILRTSVLYDWSAHRRTSAPPPAASEVSVALPAPRAGGSDPRS